MTLQALAAIVGERNLLHVPDDLVCYDCDGRHGGGRARAVVRPASTAEVSAIVRASAELGIGLVPQGARTGLVGAGLADGHVVISLERLNRVCSVDAVNRTAQVEAGSTLSVLNAAASPHGLYFPIDLGADPSIGGMVASNTGGARLLRYGDMRRNVLGLQVVLSDTQGTILNLGKPLWKDNSCLDMKHLWIGSGGAMGIVTEASLALQPIAPHRISALLSLRDAEAAMDILQGLEAALGSLLTAFEGMSGRAMRAALDHVHRLQNPFTGDLPPYALLVELSAGHSIYEAILEEALADGLARWMDGANAPILDAVVAGDNRLWDLRHAIPEGLHAMGKVTGCDVALKRTDVMRCRAVLIEKLTEGAPQMRLCDFGHIGDGGMHFNLVWDAGAGAFCHVAAEAARKIVFDTVVREFGGSFSAEHGLGPANADYYAMLVPPEVRGLAGGLQRWLAPVPIGRFDFTQGLAS